MKKSLFVCLFLALCLVLSGPAMAKQDKDPAGWYEHTVTGEFKYFKNGHPGDPSQWVYRGGQWYIFPGKYTADADLFLGAFATDHDFDRSVWGWGNDTAEAGGTAGMYGEMHLFGNGWFNASVDGYFCGFGDVDLITKAWDFGLTSGAFSKAEGSGYAKGYGEASGFLGLPESAEGFLSFQGELFQNTYAAETGYAAGEIVAGQGGIIDWKTYDEMNDVGRCFDTIISDSHGGEAMIKGGSFVSIDPYGPKRSIEGSTFTEAYAPGHAHMQIAGGTGGYISNGPAFASGGASYSVNRTHTNSVAGNANFAAQIKSYDSFTKVSVSASAYAGSGQPN